MINQEELRKKGYFDQLYQEKGIKPETDRVIDFSFLEQKEETIMPNNLEQKQLPPKEASSINKKALKPRQLLEEYKQNKLPILLQRQLEFLTQQMKNLEERIKRLEEEEKCKNL